MKFAEWNSIGRRLLRSGKVSKKDLEKALRKKANGSASLKLGEILLCMGVVDEADLLEELEAQAILAAPPEVDYEAAERSHENLAESLRKLNASTARARTTLSMPAWEDSGKILIG